MDKVSLFHVAADDALPCCTDHAFAATKPDLKLLGSFGASGLPHMTCVLNSSGFILVSFLMHFVIQSLAQQMLAFVDFYCKH